VSRVRAAWIVVLVLAVLWFAVGIISLSGDDPSILVVVAIVVTAGSILTNLAYGWLQAVTERQAAARMDALLIPRTKLADALMNLSPQEVALLTAQKTQKLAEDLATSGNDLPGSRLAIHRDLLGAVRLYVDESSSNRRPWPALNSLKEEVDTTERIIGELQRRTDGGGSAPSISLGEVERYAGRLTKQSGAFHRLAGAA
jgi:hypothetical protein